MLIHDIELIKSLNLNNLYTCKQIVQIDLNSIEPFIKYPFCADSNLLSFVLIFNQINIH